MCRAASQQGRRAGRPGALPRRDAAGARSERPRAADGQAELERALELVSLIESANDAVVGVSPAGLLTSWSEGAERLFGYAQAEIVGHSLLLLSPPGSRAGGSRSSARSCEAGRARRADGDRARRQGRAPAEGTGIGLADLGPRWRGRGRRGGLSRSQPSSAAPKRSCGRASGAITPSLKPSTRA